MQVNKKYDIKQLEWDTIFFGAKSAKVTLKDEINKQDVEHILEELKNNKIEFVTIQNNNNNDSNNIIMKEFRDSFLVDVNVQFIKKLSSLIEDNATSNQTIIVNNMQYSEDILNIAKESFKYSRFINDKNLKNGDKIYYEWTKNSFCKEDKYFCIYKAKDKNEGYLLFSIEDNEITIELIAVNKQLKGKGIGSKLIKEIEHFAKDKNIKYIKVGTQLNNTNAQNFYQSCGFKHITNHSIYHLWLKKENEV